ncbi:putative zinc-binding peptidase [Microbacteriaceae bacterium K1510]|nr:putative zinc-binding peptidase [Microbacteriaceae bacterium K1510]
MKLFECQHCGQPLYFENTRCESCGHRLGYLPSHETVTALEDDNGLWRALADPERRYRDCANAAHGVCNWLVAADDEHFCPACRHNRTIPDLSVPENLANWRKIETAKHRLFYSLLRLKLPLVSQADDPNALAFDFKTEVGEPVMTGHANGLITLNIAEADDAERERARHALGEPYRTLLGHFRHEIAHYYWDQLVKDKPIVIEFRQLFGDETVDYRESLKRHYDNGPPPNWNEYFVTAYASSHPWEDFAETWAHYFHMVDTLETAKAFGLRVRPRVTMGADLATTIDFDPHDAPMERIVDAWLPLTFAVNSINRSMGVPDLYPFVLAPAVIVKLAFIHALIHGAHGQADAALPEGPLRAVVAGLKRAVAAPEPPQ